MRNADLAAGPEPETKHRLVPVVGERRYLLKLAVLVDHANVEMADVGDPCRTIQLFAASSEDFG